ncbi:MAG: VWA domain-containing protein [Pyrinomonadaceae bacterium]
MKIFNLFLIILFVFSVQAQSLKRDFDLKSNGLVEITNLYGRVYIQAEEKEETDEKSVGKVFVQADSKQSLDESDIKIDNSGGSLKVEVAPQNSQKRVDLTIKLPPRVRVRVKTNDGEVRVSGNLESAEVETDTGTISADVPLENVRYNFVWTESRPRFLSDVELEKVKEKAAGKFVIKGKIVGKEKGKRGKGEKGKREDEENEVDITDNENKDEKPKNKGQRTKDKGQIELNLTTARGIILLNVNPNEVPSDLRERALTDAAKAIIRSGDSLLMEAIRRASPKYFGDYAKTLPPMKREPVLGEKKDNPNSVNAQIKKVLVRVVDINNRAVPDLSKKDFEVSEAGEKREILAVEPTTAPFNLVLLLDVSGSVDNFVDFIRKSARNFVNTVNPNDKIAIIIFNEDVKTLSTFTTNKGKLSESLDTFDAGGGTAYYDALAFTLAETLRPLKGERTAIVVLSDGDDNRSFLPFDSLLGSIQESGALVYPLYVPSGLIAASKNGDLNAAVDPLRTKYIGLTTKAEGEGEKLAQISGGVYYPIRQLSDLQKAYDDIVVQLRTAYSVTFRSDLAETRDNRASPRLKVKVNRENSFVKLGSIIAVAPKESSKLKERNFPQSPQSSPGKSQAFQNFFFTNSHKNSLNFFANFAPLREISFQKSSFANNQIAEITGEVEKINYKQFVHDNLQTYKFENFDINKSTGAFLLSNDKEKIAVSRWISPKRTRSYPYERVYDTLAVAGKKATIIPVVKDEGLGGERDFLQWDTISLLSLLDVHVVLAYYNEAAINTKRNDQITAQKFDNNYILARLGDVFNFKGTAREWNEREAKQLKTVFEKAKLAYAEISKTTKTYLHDETALIELIKFTETPQKFIEFSRQKSRQAQSREFVTDQPKEALATDTKGKVTITNALFGKYFFTVDETRLEPKTVYLIEAKHSQRAKLPGKNDIKDGLIKMMLYTNLQNVKVGAKPLACKVQIRLTSSKLVGSITSEMNDEILTKFCSDNLIDAANREFLKQLFHEARDNKFTIILEHAETAK